jgi:hypothetical protein
VVRLVRARALEDRVRCVLPESSNPAAAAHHGLLAIGRAVASGHEWPCTARCLRELAFGGALAPARIRLAVLAKARSPASAANVTLGSKGSPVWWRILFPDKAPDPAIFAGCRSVRCTGANRNRRSAARFPVCGALRDQQLQTARVGLALPEVATSCGLPRAALPPRHRCDVALVARPQGCTQTSIASALSRLAASLSDLLKSRALRLSKQVRAPVSRCLNFALLPELFRATYWTYSVGAVRNTLSYEETCVVGDPHTSCTHPCRAAARCPAYFVAAGDTAIAEGLLNMRWLDHRLCKLTASISGTVSECGVHQGAHHQR